MGAEDWIIAESIGGKTMNSLRNAVPLGSEAAFPKSEFERRVAALQNQLRKHDFELYMTSGAENIFYLCGQQTPGYYSLQCLFVPAEGSPFLIIRDLESYNARSNTFLDDIEGYSDASHPASMVVDALKRRGWAGKRLAVDRNAWFLTVNIYEKLLEIGKILDGSGLVEALRRVKSDLELGFIREAAKANDAGMRAGLRTARAGVTENDVAAEIMAEAIRSGSEYMGMEPFVTSGPRSGIPHTTWRRRRIRPGDLVAVETAAAYNRYHVALFRTVAVGRVPDLSRENYKICLETLEEALENIKPGRTCEEAHVAAQKVIDRHNRTDGYRKRLGYSLGISFAPDWGEGNILSLNTGVKVPLETGMVFHVPITLREYAKFTVAVSESVIVNENGCETLSTISRELVEA
jgi:Xaa-Pro dipeptidase